MGLFSLLKKTFSSNQKPIPAQTPDNEVFISKDATILIVDDSKTHVAACKKWLEEAGYETLTAFNGREGIMITRSRQPDLVLMDIVMPKANGFQATRYLKKHNDTKHIPIIMMSGEEQNSGKIWAKKLGASSFLVKPLNKVQLLGVIDKVLAHFASLR
jgi:twitching motility two-component system response regulator PilH